MAIRTAAWGRSRCLILLKKDLVLLFIVLLAPVFSIAQNGEDLRKQADTYYSNEEYTEAYRLYSQLVANYPKDPELNFRLGVCMIYSEPDKKKSIPFLKQSLGNPAEAPKEAYFYLGKAYHMNYRFDEAVKNYNEFKAQASSSVQKKLGVDREIAACQHGKQLLSNLTDLVILNKKQLPESDYFRSYNLKQMNGKLLAKPDEFKLSADRKKKDKSVVFLSTSSDVVYFSSYGDKNDNGRDIYTVTRQPGGNYSKPKKVESINTPLDEDYPFLHPNGKILYFASKGHNSMGGYDIFKSELNESTNSWGPPQNLEFPVNSPDDDYLFVTDSAETMAFFSTGRQSPPGKVDVLKVKTERRSIDVVAVNGMVTKGQVDHSLASSISVKNLFGDQEVGTFDADENGKYTMELPNGAKLVFTVATPGLETQSAQVTLPMSKTLKAYRQTISYEDGKLKILNYFDDTEPPNYMDYLKVIEEKAKLDVNTSEDGAEPAPLAVSTPGKNTSPQITNETKEEPGSSPKKNLSNTELLAIAKKDAEESHIEAAQMSRDAKEALETGNKKKTDAETRLRESEKILTAAEGIPDEAEKQRATTEALDLKKTAENDLVLADKILAYGAVLDADAKAKEKEAALNEQYAKELQKTANGTGSSQNLESLQKEIEGLAARENSSESLINELKTELGEKETQLTSLTASSESVSRNLEEITTAIKEKETELEGTKKKKAKAELVTQIDELKKEEEDKKSQLVTNESSIKSLTGEIETIKTELQLAEGIRDNNLAANEIKKAPVNNSAEKLSSRDLKNQYKDKIAITDSLDALNFEQSIAELNNFNADIESSLQKNRADLSVTKTPAARQKITDEIKQLDTQKKKNQATISSHFKKINELKRLEEQNKPIVDKSETYSPITTKDPREAVELLNELSTDIGEVNDLFVQNLYTDVQARRMKDTATRQMVDLAEKEKTLQDLIAASTEKAKAIASYTLAPVNTPEIFYNKAEELSGRAQALRSEASNAGGAQKTKLLNDARALEESAADNNIAAAEIVKTDNANIVATNSENIQNLIAENRSSEEDIAAAKKLSDEAVGFYKKAAEIRQEVGSGASKGARLGNSSNAEEQEAEAIARQQQALTILLKTSPDYPLKAYNTSTTAAASYVPPPSLDSALSQVNAQVAEIASLKVPALQKLYDANQVELTGLNQKSESYERFLLKSTALRREHKIANTKKTNAEKIREDAEMASTANDKINLYSTAIKQQTEAIQLLRVLNTKLEKMEAEEPPPVVKTEEPVADQTPVTPTVTPEIPVSTNTPTVPESQVEPVIVDPPPPVTTSDTKTLPVGAATDTTSEQVIAYFDQMEPTLANEEASSNMKASLSRLKDLEAERKNVTAALISNEPGTQSAPVEPLKLRRQADDLLAESEELFEDSQDAKSESSKAKGDDKKNLLAESKELEAKSERKMLESADLIKQANEAEYVTNAQSITELLERLNNDNPGQAEQLQKKNENLQPLKEQIKKLRDDAANLTNNKAKLGAIGNAEEKETELIKKQNDLLSSLKKKYPDYVAKPYVQAPGMSTDSLAARQAALDDAQIAELTTIINAFSLEYETQKTKLTGELTADEQKLKQNADDLNAESKNLLVQSADEADAAKKIRSLSIAAKSGYSAVIQLNNLVNNQKPVVAVTPEPQIPETENKALEDIGKQINSDETDTTTNSPEPAVTPAAKTTLTTDKKGNLVVKGLTVIKGNAYTNAKPIPLDSKMDDGLVFRVQIGAFRTVIPNNAFKGLSPLNGETTPNGYIRYTAGNFTKIEFANAVKNDLRGLGYADAFVVAYLNGKRITLGEAMNRLNEQGVTVDPAAPQSAGITSEFNVPKAAANTGLQEMVSVTKELEKIDGMLFTIQIGVFTRQITKTQLKGLRPIYTEELKNGLYRYTAGIYSDPDRILKDKEKVNQLGLKDAFVSAYLNGQRIGFSDAKARLNSDSAVRLETENPIIFPREAPLSNTPQTLGSETTAFPEGAVTPFSNNVLNYPPATPENGIKTDEAGISYKVQIGAYTKEVPDDVAEKFSAIRTWPVEHKVIANLYVYNVGNFTEVNFARALKEELKALGITDVFVTVYENGKKLYGPDAEKYLR